MKTQTIVERIEAAGFRWFEAKPFPAIVVPIGFHRYDALNALVPLGEWGDHTAARVIHGEKEGFNFVVLVMRQEHYEMRYLCHELIHMKNAILGRAGVRLDTDNDEFEAYFTGMLAEHAFSIMEDEFAQESTDRKQMA